MSQHKRAFARQLRQRQTPAEALLWALLRGKRTGFKFRRQHVIAGFILDFYCPEVRMVIEVDGPVHHIIEAADRERTAVLIGWGLRIIRFTNEEVLEDPQRALLRI